MREIEGIFVLCPCRIVSLPESLRVGGRGPAHRPGSKVHVAGAESVRCRLWWEMRLEIGKVQTPNNMTTIKCSGAKVEVCAIETPSC